MKLHELKNLTTLIETSLCEERKLLLRRRLTHSQELINEKLRLYANCSPDFEVPLNENERRKLIKTMWLHSVNQVEQPVLEEVDGSFVW